MEKNEPRVHQRPGAIEPQIGIIKIVKKKVAIAALMVATLAASYYSKTNLDIRLKAKFQEDMRLLPSTQTAKFMALDFKEALGDIFWIEGLNYFGSQLGNKNRTYKYLPTYIDLIFKLDPYFRSFYDWAATAFIYNALEITRDSVVKSTYYVNEGIKALSTIGRYDDVLLQKGAFNFALESKFRKPSIPYFTMAARIFPNRRDLLLVASAYAELFKDFELSHELKLEYLGFVTLESVSPEQIRYAIGVITSPKFNTHASSFVRALRLNLEKDEDLKKIVKNRLEGHPFQNRAMLSQDRIESDPRYRKLFTIDRRRNFLPPSMQLLLM